MQKILLVAKGASTQVYAAILNSLNPHYECLTAETEAAAILILIEASVADYIAVIVDLGLEEGSGSGYNIVKTAVERNFTRVYAMGADLSKERLQQALELGITGAFNTGSVTLMAHFFAQCLAGETIPSYRDESAIPGAETRS